MLPDKFQFYDEEENEVLVESECPTCDGSGLDPDADGCDDVCPDCDGTGVQET